MTVYEVQKLNTSDHFRFMFGYEDDTFKSDENMSRAEAAAMFGRLLLKGMDNNYAYKNNFTDVNTADWYANIVGYMSELGILRGYEDGTFRPNATITRAEFAAIAARFDEVKKESVITFTDLPKEHWARTYIAQAVNRGWINGYPNDTFAPESNITRAEATSIAVRMLGRSADVEFIGKNVQEIERFSDLTFNHWAYYNIMEAANGHEYTRVDNVEKWENLTIDGDKID